MSIIKVKNDLPSIGLTITIAKTTGKNNEKFRCHCYGSIFRVYENNLLVCIRCQDEYVIAGDTESNNTWEEIKL
jgi:hypothetical protein